MKVIKKYKLIFVAMYNIIVYMLIPWIVLILGKNRFYGPTDFIGIFIFIYQIVGTFLGLLGLYIYKKSGGVPIYYFILQSICIFIGVIKLSYFIYTSPVFPEIGTLLLIGTFPVLIIEIIVIIYQYVKAHYRFFITKK